MQDADLLVQLAGIAGVFVGFGALISIRSGSSGDAHELVWIRGVMSAAIWVIVASIGPVVINRYGISGHELWAVCSLLGLALFWGNWFANQRTPEHRADAADTPRATILLFVPTQMTLMGLVSIALILVVLGLLPEQEPALYLSAVALALFDAAFLLLVLVYSQGRQATGSDPAALPATGGSSA